jgi:hypothetical protein
MRRALLTVAAALAFAAPAQAEDYVVTGTGDAQDASCEGVTCQSLRAALTAANGTTTVDDTITLSQPGTIQLLEGTLTITDAVTITGQGANATTIAADQDGGRVLTANDTAGLSALTLSGGSADVGGALLVEDSTVTLSRVRVTGGTAQSGGAIANRGGTLNVTQSLVDNGFASQGDGSGGGIANLGSAMFGSAALTVVNSTIAFNTARVGGGIVSTGDPGNSVTTTGATIAQNHGNDSGGGVHIGAGTWLPQLTLVADNFQEQTPNNCTGTDATSQGWNLETGEECGFTLQTDKRRVVDARLATELGANDGPTLTLLLKPGSQALNIQSSCTTDVDQRAVARPQGTGCDAGAFESADAPSGPPVITSPAPDLHTNANELQFSGTADPDANIIIFLGDTVVTFATADAQGAWSGSVELPAADGVYTYGVSANGSPRTRRQVTVDRRAVISSPADGTHTNAQTLDFSGTTLPNVLVQLYRDDIVVDSVTSDANGQWVLANVPLLEEGTRVFRVLATDEFSAPVRVVVDRTAPAVTITSSPSATSTSGDVAFTYSSDEVAAFFTCRLVGPGRDDNEVECPAGGMTYTGLPNGQYEFRVRARDRAGNFLESVGFPFTVAVATEAPAVVTPQATPTPVPTATPIPQPQEGETVVTRPTAGRILIRLPGSSQFTELRGIDDIPLGATIDARNGRVQVRFESEPGKIQVALFYGGMFRVTQVGRILDLRLNEPLAACPKKRGKASAAQAKKAKKRKLWGDGKGAFRTSGKYSAATVRGTKWLVEDSCAGTLTRVATGVVAVRHGRKTVLLRSGKRYLAKAR